MRGILQGAGIAALAASCLAIAGCDSKGTTEVKQEAKAIDASYKAQADLVEATGKNGPDNAAAENQADALRNEGKAVKEHLDKEANELQHDTKH
jgi:gas vesicle protein